MFTILNIINECKIIKTINNRLLLNISIYLNVVVIIIC